MARGTSAPACRARPARGIGFPRNVETFFHFSVERRNIENSFQSMEEGKSPGGGKSERRRGASARGAVRRPAGRAARHASGARRAEGAGGAHASRGAANEAPKGPSEAAGGRKTAREGCFEAVGGRKTPWRGVLRPAEGGIACSGGSEGKPRDRNSHTPTTSARSALVVGVYSRA